MHTMSDPRRVARRVGGRYLFRMGLVGILSALLFSWLLRLPFTSDDDSFDSSANSKGPVFAEARGLKSRACDV